HVDTFVEELRWEETDTLKRDKIRELKLTNEEWTQHADKAQQSFSSDQVPTLYLAIPALEALYRAWSSRINRQKYAPFASALEAACKKIDNYYGKTTNSPVYIMTMILNPHEKLSYFTKHWPKELQQDVLKCVEEVEQFLRFNNTENAHTNKENKSWSKGSKVLLRELSDDKNEEDASYMEKNLGVSNPGDPEWPWLPYFDEYIYTKEQVPTGWSAVEWWGELGPLSLDEAELENNENKDKQDGKGFEDENGWDELFSDDDEDDFDVDIDIVSD
ncbi:hypothetical protein C0993_003076, partial [Termitomyces sp. T159_Od127]